MTEANALVMGVDIGGTKVAVGLIDASGKIVAQGRAPMVANGTADEGLHAVTKAIDSHWSDKVRAIGICAPGPLDPTTGVILNPPNVACWRNFPLGATMTGKYSVPVKVDNDANAAALAEDRKSNRLKPSQIPFSRM